MPEKGDPAIKTRPICPDPLTSDLMIKVPVLLTHPVDTFELVLIIEVEPREKVPVFDIWELLLVKLIVHIDPLVPALNVPSFEILGK